VTIGYAHSRTLLDLTREILSVNDPDVLLRTIAVRAVETFRVEISILRLKEDGQLRLRALHSIRDELATNVPEATQIGEGVCGAATKYRRIVLYDRNSPESAIAPVTENVVTAACAPLMIGERVVGAFGLYNHLDDDGTVVPFSESDRDALEGFASIAAIVIDRSLAYENILRQERDAHVARRQVEELQQYLQSLIANSADAIVTTDLQGLVTSWNAGAERIFGYSVDEVIGRELQTVPHFLQDVERRNMEQIRRGETIREIETVRLTKQGIMIDVSITLSPIKNASGEIVGVSGIGRDITEKKRTEKELVRKNNQLQRLFLISAAMRGTLELDRVLRMVLTAVTVSDGLGFNRAMLFLVNDEQSVIRGAMGVGPATHEEAWEIWSRLSVEHKSLPDILRDVQDGPLRKDSFMDRLCCGVEIPLEADTILARTVKEKRAFHVADVRFEPLSDTILIQQLGTNAYATVPLVSRDKVIGVLWVDNLYSQKPITEHDLEFLQGFTDQIASAIENARLFEHVARAEQELENIFESISDLVYFVDSNYTIRKINRAVVNKIGLPEASIIGQKCYWIFHGMNMPWQSCPHHQTIATRSAMVGELEDPHLGGTYLISSSPIFDKTGSLIGTVHIARDVSELKQLREKVASVERMAALGEMAAKVAHEIRNPLLSIGGFASRLERRLENDQREQARIIVDEVKRLETILNSILGFVRSSRVEKKTVSINALVNDVVVFMEPSAHEHGNRIRLTIQEELSVLANYDRLKEALLNLISNANQATTDGEITVRVYPATAMVPSAQGGTEQKNEVVIEVQDTGTGINKDDINRIFDPFFTSKPLGTGLGLSITKRIIEEHAGTIDVQSTAGSGTNFIIHLMRKED